MQPIDIKPLSVLLVDDHPAAIWGIRFYLTRCGYQVTTANNGAEAIDLLTSRTFDLLVTDVQMPLVDGLKLVQWCVENRQELPVVVITASESQSLQEEFRRLGVLRYLEKPIDTEIIVEVLKFIENNSSHTRGIPLCCACSK